MTSAIIFQGKCHKYSMRQNSLLRLSSEVQFWLCIFIHKKEDPEFPLFSLESECHSNVHLVAEKSKNVLIWKTALL